MRIWVRQFAGYGVLCLLSVQLTLILWLMARANEIGNTGTNSVLREYVAPSWRCLASRVRAGETILSASAQAEKFEKVSRALESLEATERELTQLRSHGAWLNVKLAAATLVLQVVFGLVFSRMAARREVRSRHDAG